MKTFEEFLESKTEPPGSTAQKRRMMGVGDVDSLNREERRQAYVYGSFKGMMKAIEDHKKQTPNLTEK